MLAALSIGSRKRWEDDVIPAPEQHESAYLLPEKAVDGGVVFGI
jgi:hypothetical protein